MKKLISAVRDDYVAWSWVGAIRLSNYSITQLPLERLEVVLDRELDICKAELRKRILKVSKKIRKRRSNG